MFKKKLIGVLTAATLALTTLLPFGLSVHADEPQPAAATTTESVTLHKLVMEKTKLDSWNANGPVGYDGSQDLDAFRKLPGAEGVQEVAGVYFAWKYTGDDKGQFKKGKYVKKDGTGTVDDSFELSEKTKDQIMGGLTEANGIKFTTSTLTGQFEIEEFQNLSTYQNDGKVLAASKAVPVAITLPLVNENGIVRDAHVYPKNTEEKPKIDKDFKNGFGGSTGANADKDRMEETTPVDPTLVGVGDNVPYHIQTKVQAGAKYKTFRWSDVMTKGLTFNNDITVTVDGSKQLAKTTHYTLKHDLSGFTLELNEEGLKEINGKNKEVTIDIHYSATVNSDAVVEVPDKNDVRLVYSNKPKEDNEESPETPPTPDKEIKVTKTWGNGGVAIEDVTFDLYKKIGEDWKVVDTKVLRKGETEVKFTGLDKDGKYKVRERVSSSTPKWSKNGDGDLAVTNTPDNDNPPPLNPEEPSIVTGGKKFVKASTGQAERLAGAKFVVKDKTNDPTAKYLKLKDDTQLADDISAYEAAEKKYKEAIDAYNNRANDEEDTTRPLLETIKSTKQARDEAFKKAHYTYEWTTDKSQALVLMSDDQGRFEVTGLKEGTYYLEETQAPKNYANQTGDISFQITKASYSTENVDIKYTPSDENPNAQFVENKKVSIPQTGGIGTIIFTVVGLGIMLVAAVSLKKRNAK